MKIGTKALVSIFKMQSDKILFPTKSTETFNRLLLQSFKVSLILSLCDINTDTKYICHNLLKTCNMAHLNTLNNVHAQAKQNETSF